MLGTQVMSEHKHGVDVCSAPNVNFKIYRAEHNFGAEHVVPKLNGAEVRIPLMFSNNSSC